MNRQIESNQQRNMGFYSIIKYIREEVSLASKQKEETKYFDIM